MAEQVLEACAAATRAPAQSHRSACMATATPATCCGRTKGRISGFRRLPHSPAITDLWMLLSGERADMTQQFGDVLAGWWIFVSSIGAKCTSWSAAPLRPHPLWPGWPRLGHPAFPAPSWFNTQRYW
ncbi:MAG: hypothetical protein M5R42_09505 [Rhodocyclaceae bacterium]|nr:hypothetical protein [Rhodocyclaceae bacterium]